MRLQQLQRTTHSIMSMAIEVRNSTAASRHEEQCDKD